MKRKVLRIGLLFGLIGLLVLAAGVVLASSKQKAELPQYVGSQACLGCHVEEFTKWEPSGHHNMLTPVLKASDLPGDLNTLPADQREELLKADYIVAHQRFLARDRETGDYKYLNVQWNGTAYVAYKGGANWSAETGCAGCHSTGYDTATRTFAEPGIGCESCHGAGRDHILGKGDVSKITVSTDAQVCGQCHTGGTAVNGARWPVGYRPGMKIADVMFNVPVVDPHGDVPSSSLHWRQYPLWAASAHANTITSLESSGHSMTRCYACHSADAIIDKTFDPKSHAPYNAVTCVACHDPHNSTEPGQLRMEPQALCTSCHNGSIPEGGSLKPGSEAHHPMKEMLNGYGAVGITNVKGAHSGLKCVDCHMTEGNHLMHVIRPDDVAGTNRKDTCTSCHKHSDSTAESRAVYLELWQESVGDRLTTLQHDIDRIDAILKANPKAFSADLKAKYDAARTNYTFVNADASKGVHNFEYAVKILTAAQKDIDAVKAAIR